MSDDAPPDEDLRAADGRVPGRRGLATRAKLLEQTRAMLVTSSYRDLKVVDIAREAGTSPATFYQYFADVEAAILVLAEEMATDGAKRFSDLVVDQPWRGQQGYLTAQHLVRGFVGFWEDYSDVLRVVELVTEEGDGRFRQIRTRMLNGLTVALADVIEQQKRAGRHPDQLDPTATAGVLVAMLANVSARRYGFEFWGIRTDDMEYSMARVIFTAVTGQRAPKD